MAAFRHDHRAWFRLWLPLDEVTLSHDTYLRLVHRRVPETVVKAALWLRDGTRLPGLEALILALDGKVARRSGDRAAGLRPLHLVSAFLVREELTLAQEPCDAKSNEITAIPRLRDRIHLEGALATIDAAGRQTAIVQALRAAGSAPSTTTSRAGPWMRRPCWRWSAVTGGNGLHRTLDIQFREDDGRIRTGHAPAFLGILHRTTLNMLRTIQRKLETDVSIRLLRDRIGRQPWNLGLRPALNPTLRLPWDPTTCR